MQADKNGNPTQKMLAEKALLMKLANNTKHHEAAIKQGERKLKQIRSK